MVHPSDLLRTDSMEVRQFSAPRNATAGNTIHIDCGIKSIPCLSKLLKLEKYAKPLNFLLILSLLGTIQTSLLAYFRGTTEIWRKNYNINADFADWLINLHGVFLGVLAIFVSYWGNRIHRIVWIGGLTMFLSISALILLVPEIYLKREQNTHLPLINSSNRCTNLCMHMQTDQNLNDANLQFNHVGVGAIIIFQLFNALTMCSILSHGLTYIDDNVPTKSSALYIGICLAVFILGNQLGIYSSWIPIILNQSNVFLTPVWILYCVLLFIFGFLIVLFPYSLPSMVIRRAAASILHLVNSNNSDTQRRLSTGTVEIEMETKNQTENQWTSIRRLLLNKILMINIIGTACTYMAFKTFWMYEKYFDQSRFYVAVHLNDFSRYFDDSLQQFTTNLLKYPLIAISIFTTGLIIVKNQPNPINLIKWKIAALVIGLVLFVLSAFIQCEHDLQNNTNTDNRFDQLSGASRQIIIPYCSSHCNCGNSHFQPICIHEKTYFSPCYAGCTTIDSTQNIYRNCSCGKIWYKHYINEAIEGSCNQQMCQFFWGFSKVNNIIATAILSTTYLINFLINMRCIPSKYKALAIGIEISILNTMTYLPMKILYKSVANSFCRLQHNKQCSLVDENVANFLSIITIILLIFGILFTSTLLFYVKNDTIQLYILENFESSSRQRFTRNTQNNNNGSGNNTTINTNRINERTSLNPSGTENESVIEVLDFNLRQTDVEINQISNRQRTSETNF